MMTHILSNLRHKIVLSGLSLTVLDMVGFQPKFSPRPSIGLGLKAKYLSFTLFTQVVKANNWSPTLGKIHVKSG